MAVSETLKLTRTESLSSEPQTLGTQTPSRKPTTLFLNCGLLGPIPAGRPRISTTNFSITLDLYGQ